MYDQLLQVGLVHPGPGLEVEDRLDLITVEQQVTHGPHREELALPDLHLLQVLELVGGKDLVKTLISDLAHGADGESLDVEAEREEDDQHLLGARAGDGDLLQREEWDQPGLDLINNSALVTLIIVMINIVNNE